MPDIVNEGRRVINNIQRSATLFLVKNIFSLGLTMISMFTNWPYPLAPSHLTILSALTIGVPAFLLALEPNYERIKGHFLRGVLRRAFPGGLTNIFVVLMAQAFMVTFAVPLPQIQTVSTAILAMVGMLVLFQVCKPFGWFRRFIWASMAVALVLSFTFLGSLFELQSSTDATLLLMANLLIMTPTVFFAIQRVFDWGDRFCAWVGSKFKRKK
jgi:cation-transporting ATPase E